MARFYAACLASYNNGVLHGRWIDLSSDADEMQEAVNAMLRESKFPNVTVKCPECEGAGKPWGFGDSVCEVCGGSGTVPSAEEFAIHDYDDMPSSFGEYPSLGTLAGYGAYLEEFDEHDQELLDAVYENYRSVEEASDAMRDNFITTADSFRAYADEAADEQMSCHTSDGKIPQFLINYFDYEAYARDLRHDYTVLELSSGVAILNS